MFTNEFDHRRDMEETPRSVGEASTTNFVVARPSAKTDDAVTMRGCGFGNFGVDREELRRRIVMPEYLRLAMRDCIKRKDSTAVPDHLVLPGAAAAATEELAPHTPMVVFINPKSGGRHGPVLKERLQQLMSEEQVTCSCFVYQKLKIVTFELILLQLCIYI